MTYASAREEFKGAGGDAEAASLVLTQFLDLNTGGAILHPNFVDLTAHGRIGLSQQKYKQNGASDRAEGSLLEYDLTADILKEKHFPAQVRASRSDQAVPRRFASSLRVERDSHGFTLRKADRDMPMTLAIDRERVVEGVETEGTEGATSDRWNLAYDVAKALGPAGTLSLRYLHSETQTDIVEENLEKDDLEVRHNVPLGGQQHHRLASTLRYSDRKGITSLRNLDMRTQLRLRHTDNLSTRYTLNYKERQRNELSQELVSARAAFTHNLYQSLKTTGQVRTSEDRYDTGRATTRRGGRLSFNYRKLNKLGVLFLGCSGDYNTTENKGSASTLFVVDESHQISSLQETFLVQQSIIQNTIFVTDTGGNPYSEIADYIVTENGTSTTLRIAPVGSGINEGDEVLVSYQYTSTGGQRQQTNTRSYYIRHAFSLGFTPYIRYMQRDVTITPRSLGIVENDERTTTIGAEQRLGPLVLTAERRDSDLATSPYRSTRYGAGYHIGRRRGTRLDLSADYSSFEFLAPNQRETRVYSIRAAVKHPLAEKLLLTYSAGYRKEQDSEAGDTSWMVGRAGLTWAFRTLRFAANVEHSRGEYTSGDTQRTALGVSVERRF